MFFFLYCVDAVAVYGILDACFRYLLLLLWWNVTSLEQENRVDVWSAVFDVCDLRSSFSKADFLVYLALPLNFMSGDLC